MRCHLLAPLVFFACLGSHDFSRAGESLPTLPRFDQPRVDDFAYPDAQTAQAAWKPMNGTAEVSLVSDGATRALKLPCNFRGTTMERASWDRAVKLDLTACRGVRFDFYCPDLAPVAHFSCYLRSGKGWYSATFGPAQRRGWSTVRIEKTDTQVEGEPAGWGEVDTIRISAWRGRDVDTHFYIANFAIDGADAPIAIIRGESVEKRSRDESRSTAEFTKTVASSLDQLGLPYVIMSDLDVTAARLRGKTVAILPYNPQVPENACAELVRFVHAGGKLQVFYTIPPQLAKLIGVSGGNHLRPKVEGQFSAIRPTGAGLVGMPSSVGQTSWNIRQTEAVKGESRVVASWFDDRGQPRASRQLSRLIGASS